MFFFFIWKKYLVYDKNNLFCVMTCIKNWTENLFRSVDFFMLLTILQGKKKRSYHLSEDLFLVGKIAHGGEGFKLFSKGA